MRSRAILFSLAVAAPFAWGQTEPRGKFKVDFPKDSPVAVVSADFGQSRPAVRGGAMVLDLHTALSLRNSSQRKIRAVTLMVLAQDVTPGGKGSVSVPSLDAGPGETFPVRVDLRLLRPLQGADTSVVEIALDGVLFDDLSFYGPNRLESRRAMTVWELEAQRDRRYFKTILDQAGAEGLQKAMLTSIARLGDGGQSGVQMVRGRSTNFEPEQEVKFAFLHFPDAPVEPLSGIAQVAGNEARAPRIDVRNRGSKPVRYFELGWIVEDQQGRQVLAGSVPAEVNLSPGQRAQVVQQTGLKFSDRSPIRSMTGFVSSVEFADGRFWIPSREQLSGGALRNTATASGEEQRLVQIYQKRGPKALIEELRKF